jgi:hypothetical protein
MDLLAASVSSDAFLKIQKLTKRLISLIKIKIGAGEGNRTLVTAIVVSSG